MTYDSNKWHMYWPNIVSNPQRKHSFSILFFLLFLFLLAFFSECIMFSGKILYLDLFKVLLYLFLLHYPCSLSIRFISTLSWLRPFHWFALWINGLFLYDNGLRHEIIDLTVPESFYFSRRVIILQNIRHIF